MRISKGKASRLAKQRVFDIWKLNRNMWIKDNGLRGMPFELRGFQYKDWVDLALGPGAPAFIGSPK